MTLPNSGSLSFTQIVNEFGNRGSLGNYRVNQNIGGRNWTLDEGVPPSGSISFGNLRGKRRNIVVDCYSSGGSRVSASSRGRTTVGGGPTSTSGARIIIYINKTFTSDSTQSRNRCALRTGSFNNAAKMDIIMGNSGKIYGGGGWAILEKFMEEVETVETVEMQVKRMQIVVIQDSRGPVH
jgi:hypothetical protein